MKQTGHPNIFGASISVVGRVYRYSCGIDYIEFDLILEGRDHVLCIAPISLANAIKQSDKISQPVMIEGSVEAFRASKRITVHKLYYIGVDHGIQYDDTFLLRGAL